MFYICTTINNTVKDLEWKELYDGIASVEKRVSRKTKKLYLINILKRGV